MNCSPFSITFNLLLTDACDSASDSKSVVDSLLETFDDVEGNFLFLLPWAFVSSFFSFQFPKILNSRMYLVFFSLNFSFAWVLSSLEKVLHILLYLQPSELFRWVSSLTIFFLPCLITWVHYRGNNFGLCWFFFSESLFELFCNIVETLLRLFWDMNFLRILTAKAWAFASTTK